MEEKVFIFDLDYTLLNPVTDKLYDDTIKILDTLHSGGYRILLCSHNTRGMSYLKRVGIAHYFDDISMEYEFDSKLPNMIGLLERNRLWGHSNIFFFDDVKKYLEEMEDTMDIKGIYIDYKIGITFEHVLPYLK